MLQERASFHRACYRRHEIRRHGIRLDGDKPPSHTPAVTSITYRSPAFLSPSESTFSIGDAAGVPARGKLARVCQLIQLSGARKCKLLESNRVNAREIERAGQSERVRFGENNSTRREKVYFDNLRTSDNYCECCSFPSSGSGADFLSKLGGFT